MNVAGSVLYLVMGVTVYLLIFKRSYMIESNKFAPKIFMAMVMMFGVFSLAIGFGHVPGL